MAILEAHEIKRTPVPRCPVCGTAFAPTGRRQPHAVDAEGRVYCRQHGGEVEPTYPAVLQEYEDWRKARADVSAYLAEGGHSPTEEEIAAVKADWR
jgi:hypothetical protein